MLTHWFGAFLNEVLNKQSEAIVEESLFGIRPDNANQKQIKVKQLEGY